MCDGQVVMVSLWTGDHRCVMVRLSWLVCGQVTIDVW